MFYPRVLRQKTEEGDHTIQVTIIVAGDCIKALEKSQPNFAI